MRHSQLSSIMPQESCRAAEKLIIETCHNELSNCPNVLIKTAKWKRVLLNWAEKEDVSKRLRMRVSGTKILYHHKIRISVSGCPNCCSRPQIADFGIVGYVRPAVNTDTCTICGACRDVCPDTAITVKNAPPLFDRDKCQGCVKCREICPNDSIVLLDLGVRLLVGGKLGRHPRLAQVIGELDELDVVVHRIGQIVEEDIECAGSYERFADFWIRTHN